MLLPTHGFGYATSHNNHKEASLLIRFVRYTDDVLFDVLLEISWIIFNHGLG